MVCSKCGTKVGAFSNHGTDDVPLCFDCSESSKKILESNEIAKLASTEKTIKQKPNNFYKSIRLRFLQKAKNLSVCPYCAESIKSAAILCRYCGKDLPTGWSLKSNSTLAKTEDQDSSSTPTSKIKQKNILKGFHIDKRHLKKIIILLLIIVGEVAIFEFNPFPMNDPDRKILYPMLSSALKLWTETYKSLPNNGYCSFDPDLSDTDNRFNVFLNFEAGALMGLRGEKWKRNINNFDPFLSRGVTKEVTIHVPATR